MSEDEDEELAMLRLQALMSKRRAGTSTSKSLPFPVSLALVPEVPKAPVTTEEPVTTVPVVVTSVPAAVPDPPQGVNNNTGSYRQPRFVHGQQPRRGHPRFPESRGGFVHGPPPSSNLIVIQTMPMEGDSKPARHRLPTAHLTGPRSQVPPLSNAPTALLRPQDKWEARETAKPKPVVTKFSRYNESSDSDECDTSDSESSSSDEADDDADCRPASSKDDTHPTDVAAVDVGLSPADSRDVVNDVSAVSEHSPTQQKTDTESAVMSAEQTDLSTKDDTVHHGSASLDSDSSSSSSTGTPPPPIRSPLHLESTGRFSSLHRQEFRKDVPASQLREQRYTRRSPLRKHEASPSQSEHIMHSDSRNERSPLRTSNDSWYPLAKNSASTSDVQLPSHLVGKNSSPDQRSTACEKKSPLRPRSQEQQSPSGGRSPSRSRSSERRPQSPPGSRYDDAMDRRRNRSGAEYLPRSRTRFRSRSPRKSADGTSLQRHSPRQRRSQSKEKNLPSLSRSRSSSRSSGKSRSRERLVDFPRMKSPSRSRSRSPVRSPFRGRKRSGSIDRRTNWPASRGDRHFALHLDSEVARRSTDAARRRSSRSSSRDRTLSTRYTRDVSSQQTAEDRQLSVKSSPHRPYNRSPNGMERLPHRTDTKSLPRQEFFERPRSKSRSTSRHRSSSPGLSERRSPHRGLSPDQLEKEKVDDGRQYSVRSGCATAKPKDSISRRLPEVWDRQSRVRKRSESPDRYVASHRRSPVPDNEPSVHNSPVSQGHWIHERSARSPPKVNKTIRSYVRKTDSRYNSRSPDRHRRDNQMQNLPVNLKAKSSAKPEVCIDEPRTSAQNKYGQNIADSLSKNSRTSEEKSEDSSVVKRLKKLAEPDTGVEERMTESTRSPLRDKSHLQEAQTERSTDESAGTEPVQISTRKALPLKRPAAPDAAVLEARKRRFEQTQKTDSRSVCIRSSSDVDTGSSQTEVCRQPSPVLRKKSKQRSKDLKESVDKHGIVHKSNETTVGKMRMDTSDISDLTSPNSSLSLEDISEDETLPVRDRQFGERSDLDLAQRQVAKEGDRRRGRNKHSKDVTDIKASTVSSVVKSVKKDSEVSEAHRPVTAATRHSQPAMEIESTVDDSSSSDVGIVLKTSVRNVVSKESSGTDIQQTLRASVHSRLGSVVTTSDADGGKPSRRKMVDKQRGNAAAAAGVKPSKPVDLRDRLRGVEPASDQTSQQADTSQSSWGFPARRRRRRQ